MENLFGQIECRSKSDLTVMRILRSAMDKTHEKLQSKDGPIEFLHERSTFYQLAAILVDGGLSVVQEETDILEDNTSNKILTDLMEIKHWLQCRIRDMKQLIVEKDRELIERLEIESELRQALEIKDRKLVHLHETILEPKSTDNEDINDVSISSQAIGDGGSEEDCIFKLKSSVDQQMWNIKQKLEDEKKILTNERRIRKSRLSSPNLSLEFLDKEINGSSPVFVEDDRFSSKKPQSESSRPNQNVLIRRMSSDIDLLKETLDFAFGKMQSAEVLPMEKQWRWTIEKDIESIFFKGFMRDLQGSFDAELKKKVSHLKDNWSGFVNEMSTLCHEVKDFFTRNDLRDKGYSGVEAINGLCDKGQSGVEGSGSSTPFRKMRRTTSEPLPDINYTENLPEDTNEADGSHLVARMIKSHECIIRKQVEEKNWLTREGKTKRDKDNNRLERRIQDAITRLDNFTKRNHKFASQTGTRDGKHIREKRRIPKPDIKTSRSSITVKSLEVEIERLKEEMDGLCFQITVMEDVYWILFRDIMKDISTKLCCKNTERLIKNDRDVKEKRSPDSILQDSIVSLLKEDIYMVFFREMAEEWKSEKEACAIESIIREDINHLVITEAAKHSDVSLNESEALKELDFQECTPRSRKQNADDQEGTPRSRKLENNGEESLIDQKLDSLLKCLEAEEDLMLRASSEIKEHSENNSLVILNCDEMDERKAIEWLITDDESTFSSVSEKLGRALQQLYTSKELLVELGQSLELSDELGGNYNQVQLNDILSAECEKTRSLIEQECDQVSQVIPSGNVLAIILQFQLALGIVEHKLHENLESKCLRLELLKREVETLTKHVAMIKTRKLIYKKAFISRCHNLKLAETEVDLLGDQVESLLCLLERIYVELNQNATALSAYFEVYDILKLIKRELNNGRCCKFVS